MHGWMQIALLVVLVGGFVSAEESDSRTEYTELGEILDQLGYEPRPWLKQFYQITIRRDEWPVQILLSLSADNKKLWLECRFPLIDDPDSVPAELWQALLAANEKIAPAHFVFRRDDARIHLYQQLEPEHLDAAGLRKSIESFDATVRKTAPFWADERFRSGSGLPMPREVELLSAPREIIELLPFPREKKVEPAEISLDRLQGRWELIHLEVRGKPVDPSVLASAQPVMEFRDAVALLQIGSTEKRMIARVDPLRPTRQLDFIDASKRIEKAIFHVDGDHLTICFAEAGETRPEQFSTNSEKNHWLLVLKRKK